MSGDNIELVAIDSDEEGVSKPAQLKEQDSLHPEDNGVTVTQLPDKKEDGDKKEKTKKAPKASIREIFSFAKPIDYLLMFVGVICAIVQGTALPLAMLFFGDVTNTFINYEVSRSTVDLFSSGLTLDSLNATPSLLYFTPDPLNPLNCSILEPVIQSYYDTTMVVCVDQLDNTTSILPLDTVIDRNQINCTVYSDVFTQLYGNIAQCTDKSTFIGTINSQIIYFVIIGCAAFLLGFIMLASFHVSSERQVYKMRSAYYKAVLRQDIAWFDLNPAGQISSRLSDDFDKILTGIGYNFALLFQWLSTFFTGFIVGFVRDWRLTLLLITLTPFLAIGGMLLTWASSYFTSRGQYAYAKAGAIAEEVLSSIRTVLAFGGEQKESARYDNEIKGGRNVGIKKGLLLGVSTGYLFFILFLSYSIAFWFGAWLVSEDYAQGGEILSVFFAVIIGAFAIGQALPNLESFSSALGAGGAIFETLKRNPDIDSYSEEGVNPAENDDVVVNNSIQFKNVSFSYPARPDVEVLSSFNLSVSVGQTLALVGHSGCGKSTVMQLLQRFYDPLSGEVIIGDHNIKDINIKYLRQLIGIVSQEPILFDLTIMDNIKFGNENATVEECKQAAKDANVHDFITQLPDGYDTLVGERGTQLSGGQKQRVAIARALVKDPKILLLDEATSALDSESERLVQTALERARKGRTTIVIAHRLSTIQNADTIVVLDKGNIVETGTHGELMKLEGNYNEMVLAQTSGSVDDAYIATHIVPANEDHPSEVSRQFSRSISKQYSRQESHQTKTKEEIKKDKLMGDEQLKKKQAEWDKELAPVPLTRVMALNGKEWYLIALGVLGAAVNGSIFPCFAFIFGEVLGAFTMRRDQVLDGIHLPAGLFLMLAVVAGVAIFVKTFCFAVSGEYLTERIRSRVFKAMLRQELGWFDQEQHSTGALTTRLSEDAAQVQGATGTRLATVVETFISLILALIIAFVYSWVVTLVILGFVPVLVVSNAIKTIIFTRHAARNKQSQTQAGKFAVDSIENIRTVTSFSLQNTFFNIYDTETSKHHKVGLLLGILEGMAYGLSQGVTFFSYVIAFRFGAYIVSLDSDHFLHTEFQNILRVMFALVFGAVAVGQASAFAPNVAKAKISTNRIFSLLDRKPLIDNYSTDGQEIEGLTGGVEVDKVSFSYPTREDVTVLQELSLSIKPGQTVALVGPSGCGKSTIVNLIERFYDPSKGVVKVDGVAVSDLNLRWLRSQLGIVSQEPILFDDSIAGNIRYGDNDREVTHDEVIEAAKSANINDFILSLPQGYNTNVGDKGTQLSGGQKQRVAIARALVRNPKILLLDEATSALDSESEKVVQEALDKAREGRTCVVIAHRLSTILSADCIVVMAKGEIVEMGTHSELIAMKGLYYQLYQHQQLGGKEE